MKRILLVDDDDLVLTVLARAAAAPDREVVAAASGAAALALLGTGPFDGVVTDLKMPGITGHDIIRATRDALPGVALIVVSGMFGHDEQSQLEREGARCLCKPFGTAEFLSAISEALGEASP